MDNFADRVELNFAARNFAVPNLDLHYCRDQTWLINFQMLPSYATEKNMKFMDNYDEYKVQKNLKLSSEWIQNSV